MKAMLTVADVAAMFGKRRRQMHRKLIRDGLIAPGGRGAKVEIPLTRLLAVYGEEIDSLALVQRLAG